MPTSDFPLVHDTAIELGTFVVVAVDPAASVALLDDEQVARESAAMRPAKYLALIKRHVDFEWDEERGAQRLTLQFALAGHGPANPPNSWASIPIYPAPAAGGSSWGAITPSPPIPWDDCYMHNLHSVSGIVSRIHHAGVIGPRLSTEDQDHVLTCAFEDQRRLGKANKAKLVQERASNPIPRPQRHRTDPPVGPNEVSRDLSKDETVFDIFKHDDMPRLKLHFEVWTDLTEVARLDNPGGIKAEIDHLKTQECMVSALLSKEPQTNAWLQGISDAEAPSVGPGENHTTFGEDDDLVMPEDAIEHRIEREAMSPHTSIFLEELHSSDAGLAAGDGSHEVARAAEDAVSRAPSAMSRGGEDPIPPAGRGGFSIFQTVLSSVWSFLSHSRSFFWGILWWRPFSRR